MLKKPYQKFYELELNNYYTLETADTTFLAVESVLPYKKLFRKGEFTTAIKMLPLNSSILYALTKVIRLEKTGQKELKDMKTEEYFQILDVKETRNELKKIIEEADTGNHRFDYRKPIHNETLKNLAEEGYELLTTELIGTYMRKQWMMRTDKNGVVRIIEATLGGKPTKTRVIDIKFHTLNRNIVVSLLNKIAKGAK